MKIKNSIIIIGLMAVCAAVPVKAAEMSRPEWIKPGDTIGEIIDRWSTASEQLVTQIIPNAKQDIIDAGNKISRREITQSGNFSIFFEGVLQKFQEMRGYFAQKYAHDAKERKLITDRLDDRVTQIRRNVMGMTDTYEKDAIQYILSKIPTINFTSI